MLPASILFLGDLEEALDLLERLLPNAGHEIEAWLDQE